MVIVGHSENFGLLDDFCDFDPRTKRWALLNAAAGVSGTLPTARAGHVMAAVRCILFLHGGLTEGKKLERT